MPPSPPRTAVLRWTAVLLVLTASEAAARTLEVGPGRPYARPSDAAEAARDGDVVRIAPGTYRGDVCEWRANGLVLRGAGPGHTLIDADGRTCRGKAAWIVRGTNVVVEGVAFTGARCADRNGAGIRLEGDGAFTVRSCAFHDNENGILCGALPAAEIRIEDCRFARNGAGDGLSHNLYVGAVRKLVFLRSASDHAREGHALKSRARETEIRDAVFDDGSDGRSSYLVNCPNGGRVTLRGCRFAQSPVAPNGTIVSLGEEGAYPGSTFSDPGTVYRNLRPGSARPVVLRDVARVDARESGRADPVAVNR